MKKLNTIIISLLVMLGIFTGVCGCADMPDTLSDTGTQTTQTKFANNDISEEALEYAESVVKEDGEYTSASEVAAYIHIYGKLPDNFITKKEAQKLGWQSKEGNLDEVAPGKSIGGDYFGNYEGVLPETKGIKYTECDINFDGTYRNGERIVFDNEENIYYSDDHYSSFTQVY